MKRWETVATGNVVETAQGEETTNTAKRGNGGEASCAFPDPLSVAQMPAAPVLGTIQREAGVRSHVRMIADRTVHLLIIHKGGHCVATKEEPRLLEQ